MNSHRITSCCPSLQPKPLPFTASRPQRMPAHCMASKSNKIKRLGSPVSTTLRASDSPHICNQTPHSGFFLKKRTPSSYSTQRHSDSCASDRATTAMSWRSHAYARKRSTQTRARAQFHERAHSQHQPDEARQTEACTTAACASRNTQHRQRRVAGSNATTLGEWPDLNNCALSPLTCVCCRRQPQLASEVRERHTMPRPHCRTLPHTVAHTDTHYVTYAHNHTHTHRPSHIQTPPQLLHTPKQCYTRRWQRPPPPNHMHTRNTTLQLQRVMGKPLISAHVQRDAQGLAENERNRRTERAAVHQLRRHIKFEPQSSNAGVTAVTIPTGTHTELRAPHIALSQRAHPH
jgi:hypothetical protein